MPVASHGIGPHLLGLRTQVGKDFEGCSTLFFVVLGIFGVLLLLVMMLQLSNPENYCVLKKGQDLPLNWQKPWQSGRCKPCMRFTVKFPQKSQDCLH